MSKRLIMLFCALFVLAVAVPAFAAVQNVKVSGDIDARYISRDNFDLIKTKTTDPRLVPANIASGGEDKYSVFNTVTRIRVDADLTDNVQTVVRLINERNWGAEAAPNGGASKVDIDLAYVTLKECLYSPLTLAIGRQELHFGNDMVIGDVNTNRTTNYNEAWGYADNAGVNRNGDLGYRKSFDSIRATLNYDPLVIDVVYARIINQSFTGTAASNGTNLSGLNAGYKFNDKRNTMVEAYVWNKTVDTQTAVGVADKADNVTMVGARVSSDIIEKVNIQQEIAYQDGKRVDGLVSRDRAAWASQTMATVTPGWKHNPIAGVVYSYFSGDSNPQVGDNDKTYRSWDPMYENQTAGHIMNALFTQTSSHSIDLMMKLTPDFLKDVNLRADWVMLFLDKGISPAGATLVNDYNAAAVLTQDRRQLGQEIDLNLTYAYTEDVQFSLMGGYFFTGKAINKNQTLGMVRANASEAIASCKVSF
jgi:hypothetical protein